MKDRISALMDGELDDKAAVQKIDTLGRDREALDTWRTYHLISDALRDDRLLSEGFSGRVSAQLAKVPTVLLTVTTAGLRANSAPISPPSRMMTRSAIPSSTAR